MHSKAHMEKCIDACQTCHDECETTLFNHCLEMGGKHVEPKHVRLMADCIEICQTSANAMLRGTEHAAAICAACAGICDACADSCDELKGEEMKRCADVCRSCAESCRTMSGAVQGVGGALKSGEASTRV